MNTAGCKPGEAMPGRWQHLWMLALQFPRQVQTKHPITHKHYRIGVKGFMLQWYQLAECWNTLR